MKILLTNDDGINAEGIQVLKTVLSRKHQVVVVAPDGQRSASGHGITLKNPLVLSEVRNNEYTCSGLPADCTLMGLFHLLKNSPPDLVISGINHGANLGVDTYYSGTVAGAREACIRGFKAVSISCCTDFFGDSTNHHFTTAAEYLLRFLDAGMLDHLADYEFVNLNVPNLPSAEIEGVEVAGLGMRLFTSAFKELEKNHFAYDSSASNYLKLEGSDCLSIVSKKISLSLLNVFTGYTDKSAWRDFVRLF